MIALARTQVGYKEGVRNKQKYSDEVPTLEWSQNQPWCATFVSWLALKTGASKLYPRTASCDAGGNWFKQQGRWSEYPAVGAQVFYGYPHDLNHTGIVYKYDNDYIYTIEGNTSSAPGVVPNGGAVRNKSYKLSYSHIAGYGRPDWSLAGEEIEEEMTQDKFNEMFKVAMNAYRAELQDNDCGNFSADGRKFVEETGLLVGGSKLPNGEANFMWQDFLTREQFATVLYRFAQKFGLS